MIDIAHAVEYELADSCLSPETCARLKPCLPMLQAAIGSWQANGGFSAPGIMAVCATPSGATVVHSQRWGDNVDEIDKTTALHVLVRTVEMAATDETARLLIAALSAALGKQGRASVEHDAKIVSKRGEAPLLVVLAAPEGADVAVIATTVGMPRPVAPSVMVH
jgi:hypothetical protein